MYARNLKLLYVVLSVLFLVSRVGLAQDPPTHLLTDGYFDDHVNLTWWPPGMTGTELTISHYSGPMVNAHAHWNGGDCWAITVDPLATGTYELWAISIYILSEGDPYWPWPNAVHEPLIVKAWADDGAGHPGTEIYSMQDQLQPGVGSWLVHPVTGVTASGVIYVGNQQIQSNPNCEGMGVDAALTYPTLNWYSISGAWSPGGISGDLMFEALVYGDFGAGMEARWVGPAATNSMPPMDPNAKEQTPAFATLHQGTLPPFWGEFHPFHAPSYSSIEHNFQAGDEIDVLTNYKIYRNGVYYASTAGLEESYDDFGVTEGTSYEYRVSAFYVPEGESIQSDPATGVANMPPGAPTNLIGTSDFISTMTLTWTDPIVNADGTPCVDLAGLKVYRDGVFLAQVNPGVGTYVDTPPNPMTRYTWSVTGIDEVPNEGPSADFDGAVISPWQVIPYEWVEISTTGINTGISMDDQNVGPFAFGFNFTFYDNVFTGIRVCSNGFLSFTSTSTVWTNVAIPTAAEPNNLIALFWDDLNCTTSGEIYYLRDVANQRFIVEYDNVPFYTGGGTVKAEVIFNADGSMVYAYNSITGVNNSCTVGIENATGTVGEQVCFNGIQNFLPTSGSALGWWMGAPPPPPSVTITMTPIGAPIQIPAIGGSFSYDVTATNTGGSPATFDGWTNVTLPNGSIYGPTLGPVSLTLPGGASISRTRSQSVPGSAPTGMYSYNGYVGNYPGTIYDSTSFPFEKLAVGNGALVSEWNNSGESFAPWMTGTTAEIPSEFAVVKAFPNPFNPVTQISFSLPLDSRVTLSVYNAAGREVATLVNGFRAAGTYDVTFDASHLASGIYFYRLTAGEFTANGKMVLMK